MRSVLALSLLSCALAVCSPAVAAAEDPVVAEVRPAAEPRQLVTALEPSIALPVSLVEAAYLVDDAVFVRLEAVPAQHGAIRARVAGVPLAGAPWVRLAGRLAASSTPALSPGALR